VVDPGTRVSQSSPRCFASATAQKLPVYPPNNTPSPNSIFRLLYATVHPPNFPKASPPPCHQPHPPYCRRRCYDLLQRTGEMQAKVVPQESSHRLRILDRRGRNWREGGPEFWGPSPKQGQRALIVRRSGCCRCGGNTAVVRLYDAACLLFKTHLPSTIYRAEPKSWTLSYHCFVKHFPMAADVMAMKSKTLRA
jgi:hypothetical protein